MTDQFFSLNQLEPQSLDTAPCDLLKSGLDLLGARFPKAKAEAESAAVSQLLYQSPEPEFFRVGRVQGNQTEWVIDDNREKESLMDVRREFRARLKEHKSRIYILTGFGTGQVARTLAGDLTDFNVPLIVLEPDAALFHAALRLADQKSALENRKLFFAVGKSFLEQAEEFFEQFHLCVIPEFCILLREKSISQEVQKTFVSWTEELNRRKQIPADRLNEKVVAYLNQSRKITVDNIRKVWIHERSPDAEEHTRVNRHLAAKFVRTISDTGCEVTQPQYQPQTFYPPFAAVPDLIQADPDLILFINSISTDLAIFGENFSNQLKVPKISWFVDTPYLMREILKIRGLSKSDILASTDKHWFEDVRSAHSEMAERKVYFLPLAATYDEEGPLDENWHCPVSYVGQVRYMEPVWQNLKISKSIRDVLEQIMQVMMLRRDQRPEEMVAQAPELALLRQRYDLGSFVRSYYAIMVWEANSRYRAQTLMGLADLGLKIYGNKAWTTRIKNTPLESCYTGKIVDHGDLPLLYRNSQININMHHLQSSTSFNLRVFDVPASGGFLITDYMPGLEDLFEMDREVVVYHSPEELREKVEYYLDRPDLCREIAGRARERVLRDHTFANRWLEILEMLRQEGWT